jgi:hypothetical protein
MTQRVHPIFTAVAVDVLCFPARGTVLVYAFVQPSQQLQADIESVTVLAGSCRIDSGRMQVCANSTCHTYWQHLSHMFHLYRCRLDDHRATCVTA